MPATFRRLILFAVVIVLAGCASSPKMQTMTLNDGDEYLSPDGRFSVVVPNLVRPGDRQMERSYDNSTTVVFLDQFGTLLDIEATELPRSEYAELTGPDQKQLLEKVFNQLVMQDQITRAYAGAAVKVQDYPYTPVGRAWFATVMVPQGSTLIDPVNRERHLDALRGYLVFPQKGGLYIVATQEIPTSPGRAESLSDTDRADRLLGRLKDIVGGMVFH